MGACGPAFREFGVGTQAVRLTWQVEIVERQQIQLPQSIPQGEPLGREERALEAHVTVLPPQKANDLR